MIGKWLSPFRAYFAPRAVVLMYHRVATLRSDVWEISVSPAHFEQHLAFLKKRGNVIPLPELAERVAEKKTQEAEHRNNV